MLLLNPYFQIARMTISCPSPASIPSVDFHSMLIRSSLQTMAYKSLQDLASTFQSLLHAILSLFSILYPCWPLFALSQLYKEHFHLLLPVFGIYFLGFSPCSFFLIHQISFQISSVQGGLSWLPWLNEPFAIQFLSYHLPIFFMTWVNLELLIYFLTLSTGMKTLLGCGPCFLIHHSNSNSSNSTCHKVGAQKICLK